MVVKIDVEGEELAVLEGATETIEKFRPTIIIEVHFRNEKTKIVNEIIARGYEIRQEFSDDSDPESIVFLVAEYRIR